MLVMTYGSSQEPLPAMAPPPGLPDGGSEGTGAGEGEGEGAGEGEGEGDGEGEGVVLPPLPAVRLSLRRGGL